MKKVFIIFVCSLHSLFSFSQKENNQWVISTYGPPFYHSLVDFNNPPPDTSSVSGTVRFFLTDASICDTNGQLLFYTNGNVIFNRNNDTLQNGFPINPGWATNYYLPDGMGVPQGAFIIPRPGHFGQYYAFYESAEVCTLSNGQMAGQPIFLPYSLIDMSLDAGLGGIVPGKKDIHAYDDTLIYGRITGTRHANGRDWWIITHESDTDIYDILLVTPDTMIMHKQQIGRSHVFEQFAMQAAFSPQGDKYVIGLTEFLNDTFPNVVDLFDFDRCTGMFSNERHIEIPDSNLVSTGCGFSPNGRWLYINTNKNIFQFDTWNVNINSTIDIVATWDISANPNYKFLFQQLASDGKIYISNSVSGAGNGNATSFLFSLSPNATVINNTSGDAETGFDFQGACTNAKFITNTIGVHNRGLHLNSSGVMGQQFQQIGATTTVYNNTWTNEPNTQTHNQTYSSGYGAINENNDPASFFQSEFRFDDVNQIGNLDFPFNNVTNFSTYVWFIGYIQPQHKASTYNYDCKIFREDDEQRLTKLDERIAEDSIFSVDFEPELKLMTASDLFDKLDKNDSLKNSSQLYLDFYTEKETEVVGKLSKVRTAIQDVYNDNSGLAFKIYLNDSLVQLLLLQKLSNDSLINGSVNLLDSIKLTQTNVSLMQEVQNLIKQTNALLQQLNSEKSIKISYALGLNNAISTVNTIESNEQQVNEIYLSKIIVGNYNLTSAQIAALQYVANQCPFAGGRSVYQARSLLQMLGDSAIYDDKDVCASLGFYRKSQIKGKNSLKDYCVVVPNPAISEIILYYSLPKDEDSYVEFYNSFGQSILTKKLITNSVSQKINIYNLSNGIYQFIIKTRRETSGKGKFAILK